MNTLKPDTNKEKTNKKLLKIASMASVITASLLIFAKLMAWFMTGSLSLLATLIDSAMDIIASIITLIAIRIAITPADESHHFGHGKAEQLAALAQSAFISGSAVVVLLNALDRLSVEQSSLSNEPIGIAVMVFSIIATIILLSIQYYVISKTNSAAIKADALHYKVDLLANAAVIIALLGANAGFYQIDNALAIIISGYMLYSVKKLAWDAIQNLMDQSLPINEQTAIENIALSVEGVKGVHEIRTRVSGSKPFIQLHLDLDGRLPLQEAHDIGYSAKVAILDYLPEADIIIHLDPD
ncbi:cation diffusion facilitator family transporter [Endozoicomonas sp. Mp262]|uniref:cation diffusion facilitator family transporter n=1 Tax=Endozoicomonas sp. Mp262 TaxID=2919499 RepID=UPI0021D880D1